MTKIHFNTEMAAETVKEMDTNVHSGYPAYTSRVIILPFFILTC